MWKVRSHPTLPVLAHCRPRKRPGGWRRETFRSRASSSFTPHPCVNSLDRPGRPPRLQPRARSSPALSSRTGDAHAALPLHYSAIPLTFILLRAHLNMVKCNISTFSMLKLIRYWRHVYHMYSCHRADGILNVKQCHDILNMLFWEDRCWYMLECD